VHIDKNQVVVRGIHNLRTPFRCGAQSGEPLATVVRDEDLIVACERVRHAHTLVHYEVLHASH
jgi:hypothetical protein